MTLNNEFRRIQLNSLFQDGDFQHKIKLRCQSKNIVSETVFLNITHDEFLKISKILDERVKL
jgi:hypothetical protein